MPTILFKKGQPAWNKGSKGLMKVNSGSFKRGQISLNKGKKASEETRKKIKEKRARQIIAKGKDSKHWGVKLSKEHKERISNSLNNYYKTHKAKCTPHTEETKRKISQSSKGRVVSIETRKKIGESHRGEKSVNWKGDKVKYRALHQWVTRELGKPRYCENKDCKYPRTNTNGVVYNKPKRYDWANISKRYKRDLTDWLRLCPSCHKKWDMGLIIINYESK